MQTRSENDEIVIENKIYEKGFDTPLIKAYQVGADIGILLKLRGAFFIVNFDRNVVKLRERADATGVNKRSERKGTYEKRISERHRRIE